MANTVNNVSDSLECPSGILLRKQEFHLDNRGYFYELHKKSRFITLGIKTSFVQTAVSYSKKNIIRGIHHRFEDEQEQLMTVVQGKVLDILVDLRKDNENFGAYYRYTLSSSENNQVFIPKGFGHGFRCLSDDCTLLYMSSREYNPKYEGGFRWDDKTISIDWGIKSPIIGERDANLPTFSDYSNAI